ncbi:hypothetical protein SDC9_122841 [bioreactor metagenome]|uniref:Uncharacterized protein n=1 Tax=bioreactor metagenome TaxID=1076179 RepID=A0A645CFX3_9ZZZZ|nr:hypothetical protein [Candidatus Pelethousia sp.]
MKKIAFITVLILCILLFTACGASEPAETDPAQMINETTSAVSSDASIESVKEPTISGLGIDQGNYKDEEAGVKINIQNTDWCDTGENVINFTAYNIYSTTFSAKILYPEGIYEIRFGDGMWYQYNPEKNEILDPWFDVDAQINSLTGKNAITFSEEFCSFIDSYCVDAFGYRPDELIMLAYE